MFKRGLGFILATALTVMPGCTGSAQQATDTETSTLTPATDGTVIQTEDETHIALSDNAITVNGVILSGNSDNAVYGAKDIL